MVRRGAALALSFVTFVVLMAAPAGAATVSEPIVDGLIGPLGLAVGQDGTIYVSQTFAGNLIAIDKKGGISEVAASDNPDVTIAGVDATGRGTLTYTTTGFSDGQFIGTVNRIRPNGKTTPLGDTGHHETVLNPDYVNTYGFQGLDAECAALLPPDAGLLPYNGGVDSNSYAVAILPDGSRVVADAGGNSLVKVAANKRVSTLAVLPPQPTTITADQAAMFGLPDCVADKTYNFEPVPTDVEVGPDGMLYVSTLPGGPEDPSLGARGSVYRVHPSTGAMTLIATGFLGATDLAVAPNGTIYVAELFGGRISKVVGGGGQLVAEVPAPAALEFAQGKLYATIDAFGNGSLVTIQP